MCIPSSQPDGLMFGRRTKKGLKTDYYLKMSFELLPRVIQTKSDIEKKLGEGGKKKVWFESIRNMVKGKAWEFCRNKTFWKCQLKKERLIILCWQINIAGLVQNKYVKIIYSRKKTLTTTTTEKWPFNSIFPEPLCHCYFFKRLNAHSCYAYLRNFTMVIFYLSAFT